MSFNSYSSFWDKSSDTNVDEFLGLEEDKPKGKDVVALAGYKRAISNFVNIVTGKNIPVTFNNNDESFTDGKKVVIGSNLNEKNFDVAVGLALHEGSHIALSDFNILRQLESYDPDILQNGDIFFDEIRLDLLDTDIIGLNNVDYKLGSRKEYETNHEWLEIIT